LFELADIMEVVRINNNYKRMPEFGTPSMTQGGAVKKSIRIERTAQEIFDKFLKKYDSSQIKMEDFSDIYSKDEIESDKRRVKAMKESESYEEPTNYSKVLEEAVANLAELYNWLGERQYALIRTSEYDDKLVNGAHCDVILEMMADDGSIMRMGIDLTTSVDWDRLNEKKKKCFGAVEKGKLFDVKYFKSVLTDEKGALKDIPVVMFGADKDSVHELCESVGRIGDISKHHMQYMLIEEINHNLEVLNAVSIECNGIYSEITQKLTSWRELFQEIAAEKNSLRPEDFESKAAKDKAYSYIMKYV